MSEGFGDKGRCKGKKNNILCTSTLYIHPISNAGGHKGADGIVCVSTRQDEDLSFLSPFNFPPSSPLCPLSSFTFTLHPAGVDLVASDGWQGSDAVYRIGLRGLAVSAVCKVASAV